MISTHESLRIPEPMGGKVGQLVEATGIKRAVLLRDLIGTGLVALGFEPGGSVVIDAHRERLASTAKWHGSNAAARQLELVAGKVVPARAEKKKRKKQSRR